jgi:hypothetical protein
MPSDLRQCDQKGGQGRDCIIRKVPQSQDSIIKRGLDSIDSVLKEVPQPQDSVIGDDIQTRDRTVKEALELKTVL